MVYVIYISYSYNDICYLYFVLSLKKKKRFMYTYIRENITLKFTIDLLVF